MSALSQILSGFRNLFQWWIVLAPWEAAVRVRGGRAVTVLGAGIHLRIPFLDRLFVQSTRFRISDLPIQTVTTEDGHTLTLKGQVGYRIKDIERLYNAVHAAEATVVSVVQSEISEYLVNHPIISATPSMVRKAVDAAVAKRLQGFGLADCEVSITDYARVKTYRLITQDIWSPGGPTLDTYTERFAPDA
jgi:regulator of protease activity HflC (stomatin/prohibitin superfamily)